MCGFCQIPMVFLFQVYSNTHTHKNMKKYLQLILTVVSISTTILFLFYKHQYSRLYTVLSVLETFGDENKPSIENSRHSFTDITNLSTSYSVWQKFDKAYTYSAFAIQSKRQIKIQILSIISTVVPLKQYCDVWFNDDVDPVRTTLTIKVLNDATSSSPRRFQAALLECVIENKVGTPYAVTPFVTSDGKKPHSIIDISAIISSQGKVMNTDVHLCLLPPKGPMNSALKLAEFLSYHFLVGFNRVYIYDHFISSSVHKLLAYSLIQNRQDVVVNSWKIPEELTDMDEATNLILVNDCLFRSRSASAFMFVSEMDKLLVPVHHNTINAVLKDLSEILPNPVVRVFCDNRIYCSEFPDAKNFYPDVGASLTMFRKTNWLTDKNVKPHFMLLNSALIKEIANFTSPSQENIYHVPSDVMVINWYTDCKGKKIYVPHKPSQKNDDLFFKFSGLLLKSKYIQFVYKYLN